MGIQNVQAMYGSGIWGTSSTAQLLGDVAKYTSKNYGLSFQKALEGIQQDNWESMDNDAYKKHLEKKFGVRVTAKYFNKDQDSLDALGRSMNGNDVVIAPNILEQMATRQDKARYYEEKIQYYFDSIPKWQAESAAMGLTYEPCGVAIHEDGTVYYIGGGTETPERKAQIIAAQKAKAQKKLEHWLEQKEYNKWLIEHKQIMTKAIANDIRAQQYGQVPIGYTMTMLSVPTEASLGAGILGSGMSIF